MFDQYILPVLIFAGLGLFAGLTLSLVSAFCDKTADKRFEQVRGVLPGVNCGACGFSGCDEYARYMIEGGARKLCIPGRKQVIVKIEELLGDQ